MPHPDPLAPLHAAGLSVTLTADRKLNVRPSALLTDDLRAHIREHRDAIIGALAAPSTGAYSAPPPRPAPPPTLHRIPEQYRHQGPRHAMLTGEVDPLTGLAVWSTATSTGEW